MTSGDNIARYQARLRRVIDYIHDHLDGDLSLDVLADVACMSRFHWHRVFRAMTGETIAEAIRRIRLLRAANALVLDDAPIPAIARRFGYPNLGSFSRAFQAANGKTPSAFRAAGIEAANTLRQHHGESMMFPVAIQELPPARAAAVAHKGSFQEISRAFQQLGGVIMAKGLFPHIHAMAAIYHDMPGSKPDEELRSHAAVIIAESFPKDIHGLDYIDLDGGRYAVLSHKGPYATLAAAYEWLYGQWLPGSGEEPRDGPPIEIYLNDPRTTAPEELRTEIRLPLV